MKKFLLTNNAGFGLLASLTLSVSAAGRQSGTPYKGGADKTLTLDHAIHIAVDHNAELKVSAARKEAADGRALQARVWPSPELEITADDMPTHRGGFSQAKNMAGITQVVPFPGKNKADRQIGAADAAAGTADWRLNRAELVREVKIAYCQVQTAEQSAVVAADLVQVADAAAAAAAKRNAAGEIALQEQLRAEIQLEQTQTDKVDAAREVTVARQDLVRLLGRPELRDARLTDAPDESGRLELANTAPSAIVAGHPAMLAARARLDHAVATMRRAGLEPRPDVTLGVAAGRDEAANENLMALRLSIPLPLWDRSKGKRMEAQAGVREAEARIAATQQELLAAWRTAVARYKAAAAQVTAHRERILPKSEQALHLVQTGFEEGKFNFIDYLDIQRTTAVARLAYQKKLLDLNSARADLEALAEPVPGGCK
jgi:cobalt-zinc-cadmium efflux system outer membrane protein